MATNQHVDVVRTNPEINLTQYARQGTIVPIDEYAAQSGLDKENYYAAAIDMLTVDGKLYGLPYTALPRPVLWYNDKFRLPDMVRSPGPPVASKMRQQPRFLGTFCSFLWFPT